MPEGRKINEHLQMAEVSTSNPPRVGTERDEMTRRQESHGSWQWGPYDLASSKGCEKDSNRVVCDDGL